MPTPATRTPVLLAGLLVLALLAAGCGRTGEATVRFEQGRAELEQLLDELVTASGLDVVDREPFSTPQTCELPTAADGAVSSASLRARVPEDVDVPAQASAVLVEAGYELTDEGLREGVFARRAGMRITVEVDRAVDLVLIDASTGCRPVGG